MTAAAGPVVIVGGGLAALSFAGTLRQGGYAGPMAIVSDELELAYDRPPLSKAFIVDGDAARIRLSDAALTDVKWQRGRRAEAIDLAAHTLRLDDGAILRLYASLISAVFRSTRLMREELQQYFLR